MDTAAKKSHKKLVIIICVCAVIALLILSLLFLTFVVIFLGGPASQDWSDNSLPGKYGVWKCNSNQILLVKTSDFTETSGEITINSFVIAYCYDNNYVGTMCTTKSVEYNESIKNNSEFDEDKIDYYLVNTSNDQILGPYSIEEYQEQCTIANTDMCDWIYTKDHVVDVSIWDLFKKQ